MSVMADRPVNPQGRQFGAPFQRVRRFRAPNSPLLHLRLPVNVGPLLDGDRVAARQMAIAPMAALGFEFEDQIDAYHMLSLIGF